MTENKTVLKHITDLSKLNKCTLFKQNIALSNYEASVIAYFCK